MLWYVHTYAAYTHIFDWLYVHANIASSHGTKCTDAQKCMYVVPVVVVVVVLFPRLLFCVAF